MTEYRSTLRRRVLGDELRMARQQVGMILPELSERLGWSFSKLSRIETGKLGCTEVEAAMVLAHCRVPRPEANRVLAVYRDGTEDTLLEKCGPLPDQLRTLVLHETTAMEIHTLELNRIDGLLQTKDYARAIIGGSGELSEQGVRLRVAARMDRQVLVRRPDPPRVIFYVHEQALRLPVGGPRVMHEQMLHLLSISIKQTCMIRIIPVSVGAHCGLDGPFRIMRYENQYPVVGLESLNYSLFLESPTDIASHQSVLDRLAQVSLSAEQSRSMLAAFVSLYDRAKVSSGDSRTG